MAALVPISKHEKVRVAITKFRIHAGLPNTDMIIVTMIQIQEFPFDSLEERIFSGVSKLIHELRDGYENLEFYLSICLSFFFYFIFTEFKAFGRCLIIGCSIRLRNQAKRK